MKVQLVVNGVREGEGDFGYNARTEVFENLFEAGVIDPTKVTRGLGECGVHLGHGLDHRMRHYRHS